MKSSKFISKAGTYFVMLGDRLTELKIKYLKVFYDYDYQNHRQAYYDEYYNYLFTVYSDIESYKLYASADDYERDKPINPKHYLADLDVFNNIQGKTLECTGFNLHFDKEKMVLFAEVWTPADYDNAQIKEINTAMITLNHSGALHDSLTIKSFVDYDNVAYPSKAELIAWSDYIKQDANGNATKKRAYKIMMKPTEEQRDAIEELRNAIKKCESLNIELIHEPKEKMLYAYDKTSVEIGTDPDDLNLLLSDVRNALTEVSDSICPISADNYIEIIRKEE